MAKKVAFIVGSVRKGSFNLQIANIVESMLEGKADVIYVDSSSMPFMNQDIEFPAPNEVTDARNIVSDADAVWIFTPEYNHAIPGVLKNTLDWLSRPLDPADPDRKSAVTGKKVIMTGVGGGKKTEFSRAQLFDVLTFIGMEVLDGQGRGFSLDRRAFTENIWEPSDEVIDNLKEQVELLMKSI